MAKKSEIRPLPDVSARVDVGASAKVAATAKYEVKKTIKETIPEDVTRAKAGAWLTLISPITQWAGLKGDQLAHKRELLRLQQEETLTEIASRASARLKALPRNRPEVPMKFIVPFLEKASLENADSELVELWANLLISAAENYNPHFIHFANIISQMSALQAEVFSKILGTENDDALEAALDDLNSEFLHNFMQEYLAHFFKTLSPKPKNLDGMWDFVDKVLNIVGVEIEHVEVEDMTKKDYFGGTISVSSYEDRLETDFAILDAIRLVRYVDTGYFDLSKRWRMKVMFYYVTPLGRGFAKACGIIR